MKGLPWYDKVLFFLNSLFAAALLFSYLLPFIPPKTFALLSVLSLGVPLLIMVNAIFLAYWALRWKRQFWLPLIVLLFGFNHITSIYEFSASEEIRPSEEVFSIMTYNVRQFNQFGWSEKTDIPKKISDFIQEKDPDIMAMQEYFKGELTIANRFPYKYIDLKSESAEFGLAILSKFPIINSGSLDFSTKSNNDAIFADVVLQNDTVRVISVHLQSFGVKPEFDNLEKKHTKKVFLGMGKTFVRQQDQMEIIIDLVEKTPHPVIIVGDFNNTAYSYIYREIKSHGFNDAYKKEGNGFGRTYDFDYFPLRIDYILPSEAFEIFAFEKFEVPYSDHFPIRAVLKLEEEGQD